MSRLRSTPIVVCAGLFVLVSPGPSVASAGDPGRLTILDRVILQDRGHWQIDYRLRYDGGSGRVVTPDEVMAQVDGWVSNSRANGHSLPRRSRFVLSGTSGLRTTAELIRSDDTTRRCHERAELLIANGDEAFPAAGAEGSPDTPAPARPVFSLAPGATLRVRLRLEHRHVVHGDYDPLLGARTLELALGTARLRDVLPLDREQYEAQPPAARFEPPDDRRDTHYFVSAPDSLYLGAHLPDGGYYRFPDTPVRHGTLMRLRFWYLLATGSEGEGRVRVSQYQDAPESWKDLPDARIDLPLTAVGRWTRVEHVFRIEPDATTVGLDARIDCAEVGELWIDDVTLTPVGAPIPGP